MNPWPSPTGEWYSLTDDERNRTITVSVSDVSWTREAGQRYEVRWNLRVHRGENLQPSTSRSAASATTQSSETLAGDDLGTSIQKQTTLLLDLNVTPLALASTSENVIVPQSGVIREVTIFGRKADTTSNLRTWDSDMRGRVGDQQTFTFSTAFPGTDHTVMVAAYDSTYNAGETATLDYRMRLIEGVTI